MLTGLAEFRTDRARFNPLPPAVIIERVVADDRTFAEYQAMNPQNTNLPVLELAAPAQNRVVTLPPGLQHIDIEFTGFSFLAPENVRFRYQLEGIDQNWVDAGTRRVATYTHLPPGNYHFKAIACNNDGIWNDTGASVDITLQPHIWETFWFKPLVVTVVVVVMSGSVFLVLRRRHRLQIQQLEQQRALERERARIARDLHDELGVGLTEIGLLGDLASAPDSSVANETGRGYLHEITGRARELVLLLDEIVWAINPANDTSQSLNDYFLKFAQTLLHRANIRCRLELPDSFPNHGLSSEKRHQLFLAFKESLNNVIRHSGASEVRISIGFIARNLMISVEDNGRGLETGAKPGDGLGLTGMHERLQQLGGKCEVTPGTAGGTCVKLFIPVETSKNL
jgi:signal transduction histidine kinase